MAAEKVLADYSQLSGYLLGLCRQSKNGTIFLTSKDNAAGLISLRKGKIIGISCRSQKGNTALQIFRTTMQQCSFRFKEKLIIQTDTDLPGELEILHSLGVPEDVARAVIAERDAANHLFQRDADQRSPVLQIESRAFRAIVERNAITVFGAEGKAACDRYTALFEKTKKLDDLRWLLGVIADEAGAEDIPRQAFFHTVLQHLGLDMRRKKRE